MFFHFLNTFFVLYLLVLVLFCLYVPLKIFFAITPPGLKSIEMLLPFVDILCPNEVELKMLVAGVEGEGLAPESDWDSGDSEKKITAAKKACAWLMSNTKLGSSEAGARGEMVVTLGGDGALYVQKDGTATHVPLPVKVERKDVVSYNRFFVTLCLSFDLVLDLMLLMSVLAAPSFVFHR